MVVGFDRTLKIIQQKKLDTLFRKWLNLNEVSFYPQLKIGT